LSGVRHLGDGATGRREFCTMLELYAGHSFSPIAGNIFRCLHMWAQKGFGWTMFCLSDTHFCHL